MGEREERGGDESRSSESGVDAKYRRSCQVAETAAAPLTTGTSRFSPVGRRRRDERREGEGRESGGEGATGSDAGKQGRVIDRGWKGWRRDAPDDVIACSNYPSDYPRAPSRSPPLGRVATYCPVCCLALIPGLPCSRCLLSLCRSLKVPLLSFSFAFLFP